MYPNYVEVESRPHYFIGKKIVFESEPGYFVPKSVERNRSGQLIWIGEGHEGHRSTNSHDDGWIPLDGQFSMYEEKPIDDLAVLGVDFSKFGCNERFVRELTRAILKKCGKE